MPSDRGADIWAKLKSADVLESQQQKAASLGSIFHVENAHGPVLNLTVTEGTNLAELLKSLNIRQGQKCGA